MEGRKRRTEEKIRFQKAGWIKLIVICILFLGMMTMTQMSCKAEEGWTQEYIDGEFVWRYYQNDKPKVLSWYHDPRTKQWFYFDKNGAMETGWGTGYAEGYYFDDETGVMITGWNKLMPSETSKPEAVPFSLEGETQTQKSVTVSPSNTTWYYFEQNGKMATGWKKMDSGWYYFSDGTIDGFQEGQLLTGFVTIENASYFFDEESGKMYTGMYIDKEKNRYYFSRSGIMKKDYWVTEGKARYYMGSDGRAYRADAKNEAFVATIDELIYAFDEDGKMLSSMTIYNVNGIWTQTKPTKSGEYPIYTLNVYGKGTAGTYKVQ